MKFFEDLRSLCTDIKENTIYFVKDFREHPDRLTDMLPWLLLMTKSEENGIPEGLVFNKDGSFQKTFEYRGPDLVSASKEEVDIMAARLNNCFKRLGKGWTVYAEAQRKKAAQYPTVKFPDPVSYLMDQERKLYFEQGNHYESKMYMTLSYMPPKDKLDHLTKYFVHRPKKKGRNENQKTLMQSAQEFLDTFNQFFLLFKETMYYAKELDDDETVTYLHSTISPYQHKVKRSKISIFLDHYLADAELEPGFDPMLDDYFLKVLTVQDFPPASCPGIFDQLNNLPFAYRWTTRFIPLDKDDGKKAAKKKENEMFKKRQSGFDFAIQQYSTNATIRLDNNALNQANSASAAHDAVASDKVSLGYFTTSIVILDKNETALKEKIDEIKKIFNNLGYTCRYEESNAVMAWFGTIPCIPYANVVKPILTSQNVADMFPFSTVWTGDEKNLYYNAPALLYTETDKFTPWRLNLHNRGSDVGHTVIFGPTGAGKSVLLATLISQARKYKDSQIVIFDKDASSRVLTYAMGGEFYDLGVKSSDKNFPVFVNIDDPDEKLWASEWIKFYLKHVGVKLTIEQNQKIDDAINVLADSKTIYRNITGFSSYVQDSQIRKALRDLRKGGIYGQLFDVQAEKVSSNPLQTFEMGQLMDTDILLPALKYLFHYLDRLFKVRYDLTEEEENALTEEQRKEKNRPKYLIMDECWKYMKDKTFAGQIEEWLKTMRKFNVAVILTTQEISDITDSSIKNAVINNCPTQILLPNPGVYKEETFNLYQSFNLSKKQINLIAEGALKREYYYKRDKDCRKFELALNKFALAFVATSGEADQKTAVRLRRKHKKDTVGFVKDWLVYKGLHEEYQAYCETVENFDEILANIVETY